MDLGLPLILQNTRRFHLLPLPVGVGGAERLTVNTESVGSKNCLAN